MLSYALLASKPHNRQPWLAGLREPGRIKLRRDTLRLRQATDPWGRPIMMGMGCFVELLCLAAAQRGQPTWIGCSRQSRGCR